MDATMEVFLFESSVNSEGIETIQYLCSSGGWFESSVNSEGIETVSSGGMRDAMFESSVNSEGIETFLFFIEVCCCLRAV